MEFSEVDICQIMQNIWTSILDLEVQCRAQEVPQQEQEGMLTGCVRIGGAWDGMVVLQCPIELARQAAMIMFRPELTTIDDVRDALGELVNMVGGNLKALIPQHCDLFLPSVTLGLDYARSVPDGQILNQVTFESQGRPLLITVLERKASRLNEKEA